MRTSPTRLSPICMTRPLRSLDGRRRAYRANAHQTAQKARSGKISRWENLCQPPWEAPRPPTACALPNFPKSERWKVHINSYPCSGMYRESEIHLLVSHFWNQENQRRQHTHTNSEECLTTQCHVLLWDQKCRLNRGSLAQMPLFLWNIACNKRTNTDSTFWFIENGERVQFKIAKRSLQLPTAPRNTQRARRDVAHRLQQRTVSQAWVHCVRQRPSYRRSWKATCYLIGEISRYC